MASPLMHLHALRQRSRGLLGHTLMSSLSSACTNFVLTILNVRRVKDITFWVLYITDIRNDMTSFWYIISLLNSQRWLAILLVTGVLAGELTEAHLPVMVGMLTLTYNILTRAVEGISYCGVPDTAVHMGQHTATCSAHVCDSVQLRTWPGQYSIRLI